MQINWNNIRPINNSLNDGFEELIRQLARREDIEGKHKFVPLGKPDAGVECFWILDSGNEWGWQAKFFTSSLNTTQWGEIDHSVETAIEKHPSLEKYFIALPIDPPNARLGNQKQRLVRRRFFSHLYRNSFCRSSTNTLSAPLPFREPCRFLRCCSVEGLSESFITKTPSRAASKAIC